jgi:hypothetical protein
MFWGAIVKEGQPLRSTKIFESQEFPALHLSQATLVKGSSAKITVKASSKADEIVVAMLKENNVNTSIGCYLNGAQTGLSIQCFGKGAEVHLSGHYETQTDGDED